MVVIEPLHPGLDGVGPRHRLVVGEPQAPLEREQSVKPAASVVSTRAKTLAGEITGHGWSPYSAVSEATATRSRTALSVVRTASR